MEPTQGGIGRTVCLVALILAGAATPATAVIVCDSQAGFAGIQGQNNWHYGRFSTQGTPTTYAELEYFYSDDQRWQPSGETTSPFILAADAHPGWSGTYINHSAVRQYTLQPGQGGLLRLSGLVEHTQTGGGDGTVSRLYVNNVRVFEQRSLLTPYPYSFLITANDGDLIRMEVGMITNPSYDSTKFTMTAETAVGRRVVADSRAEFCGIQNSSPGGWQYGNYTTGNAFTSMNWSWSDSAWHGPETYQSLSAGGGHPGASYGNAVRRWTSDIDGILYLDGLLADTQTGGGNGVIGRIYRNGAELWSHTITGDGGPASAFNLTIPDAVTGDIFDFEINPNGDYGWDGTTFFAIFTVPEPASATALAALTVTACLARRRVRRSTSGHRP